jgi:5-methylcytosine-specific restriction endonuclease McrA
MGVFMDDYQGNKLMQEFVDFLLPLLKPYEVTIYLYLLRKSHLGTGFPQVRVGKRTISKDCGQGTRSVSGGNFKHITDVLKALESKECISIGDTTRDGTLYSVKLPCEIPVARKRMAASNALVQPLNYYSDPRLRKELFERDKWKCQYCGGKVTEKNATLDHRVPQAKNGTDLPENLATCCFVCNSIKSGKAYEEAAPAILASIRERRLRI